VYASCISLSLTSPALPPRTGPHHRPIEARHARRGAGGASRHVSRCFRYHGHLCCFCAPEGYSCFAHQIPPVCVTDAASVLPGYDEWVTHHWSGRIPEPELAVERLLRGRTSRTRADVRSCSAGDESAPQGEQLIAPLHAMNGGPDEGLADGSSPSVPSAAGKRVVVAAGSRALLAQHALRPSLEPTPLPIAPGTEAVTFTTPTRTVTTTIPGESASAKAKTRPLSKNLSKLRRAALSRTWLLSRTLLVRPDASATLNGRKLSLSAGKNLTMLSGRRQCDLQHRFFSNEDGDLHFLRESHWAA
jgi:hypothetical protein